MIEIGKTYKTYGGWDAIVIWKSFSKPDEEEQTYVVIHKPGTQDESGIVMHNEDGSAVSIFSINEPPTYDLHHPADLVVKNEQKH